MLKSKSRITYHSFRANSQAAYYQILSNDSLAWRIKSSSSYANHFLKSRLLLEKNCTLNILSLIPGTMGSIQESYRKYFNLKKED